MMPQRTVCGDGGAVSVRRWVRLLFETSAASSRFPLDLTLGAITTILVWRCLSARPPRAFQRRDVAGLEDLVIAARELDADVADDLERCIGGDTFSFLNPVIAEVWKQAGDSSFRELREDMLGVAYECLLAAADAASGRRSRRLAGVFYTPPEIVDAIVARTVGRGLRRPSPRPPTVLDPACGSGSFLLGAYARLARRGATRSRERRERLVDAFVYGVDSDARAVRLARINLRMAALAGSRRVRGRRLERILARRLVVGSSLDEPGRGGVRVSAVQESFPDVMNRGGFDVVIGNPPYVKNRDLDASRKKLWRKTYGCAKGQFDLMVLFLEKGMDVLRPGGRLGFLVSNKFMTVDYGRALRERILDTCRIEEIVDLSRARVFRGTAIYPTILVLRKRASSARPRGRVVLRDGVRNVTRARASSSVPQSFFASRPGRILMTSVTRSRVRLIEKIEKGALCLEEVASVGCGLADARMGSSLVSREEALRLRDAEFVFPFIRVENIRPYDVRWSGRWVALDPAGYRAGRLNRFRQKKVVIPGVRPALQAAYDDRGFALGRVYYLGDTTVDDRLLLALLNSSVLAWYYRTLFGAARMAGGFLRFNGPYLRALPIPRGVEASTLARKTTVLVDERLDLGRRRAPAKHTLRRMRQLETDIDRRVSDLYGLSTRDRSAVSAADPGS